MQCRRAPNAAALLVLLLLLAAAVHAAPEAAAEQQLQINPVKEAHEDHETVAQVLLGLYSKYAGPALKAAADLFTVGLSQAHPGDAAPKLPECQQTDVLLARGGFPAGRQWGALSAAQQAHHPIVLVMMQLAYSVYRPVEDLAACLGAMGLDTSSLRVVSKQVLEFSTTKVAYVARTRGSERVFVMLRGSHEADIGINIACRHIAPGDELFGGPVGGDALRVHYGFWRAWQELEPGVVAAVQELLKQVPSKEVHVVGHSLGAAAGSIAALRLHTLLPGSIAGVWLFAAPRPGGPAFAAAYAAALSHVTLRLSNYRDFAVRVPDTSQSCSLGSMALGAGTARFNYTHVGRALLMCPDATTGLTEFRLAPGGSDVQDCFQGDEVDASAATHQMGAYFDAWRRGHFRYSNGNTLANSSRLQAVMCQSCTVNRTFRMQQIRAPARAGGPVTCAVDASCTNPDAFMAAVAVGTVAAAKHSAAAVCSGFMCVVNEPPPTQPSPALDAASPAPAASTPAAKAAALQPPTNTAPPPAAPAATKAQAAVRPGR